MSTRSPAAGATAAAPPRFVALDVFRGATIFLMILVNTAGPGAPAYPALVHAKWIGFTLADLVFPTFLFAMGNAMSFALRRPAPAGPYLRRLARRGLTIFALGYLMYWFPFVTHADGRWAGAPFALTRVPGVLQRLALCYVLAGLIVRWATPTRVVAAAAALVVGYWAILVGGSGPGLAYDKLGNIGTRLDLALLGPGHLYKKDGGFDPEGLLGTLPATANVLIGYLAGRAVLRAGEGRGVAHSAWRMALAGLALAAAGLAWAPWSPIMKKLWTGSFVLWTSGLDLILLAGTIALVEVAGWRRQARFFTITGRNPLAIYLFSELFVSAIALFPVDGYHNAYEALGFAVQRVAPGPFGSLLCAVGYTMVCWGLGWLLDRKGLILKA